jgi:hypothetical protein
MKMLLYAAVFSLLITSASAQNVSGKWYGSISQGPGGYSRLYDLELDLSQKENITGESYAYITNVLDARVGLTGTIKGNHVELQEDKKLIYQEKIPLTWVLCIKNFVLTYRDEGDREYMQGEWTGVSKEDGGACVPGKIILSRSKTDLQLFFSKGGFNNPVPPDSPIPAFTSDFNSTAVTKITEIEVHQPLLQIRLYDYLKVDNDTVSVYLNRNSLSKNIGISKRPVRINFNLDTRIDINEILLFAENLGKIPPNTSLMEIIDGRHTYRLKIESDKQKTAAIYLRYKPVRR